MGDNECLTDRRCGSNSVQVCRLVLASTGQTTVKDLHPTIQASKFLHRGDDKECVQKYSCSHTYHSRTSLAKDQQTYTSGCRRRGTQLCH
jgi:hypothetical protein